ncbi:FAD-binding oxidoreductase [Streptomonospora wellingtoniae]|uniref:FAD-binding oxidoreductase n=1 Tax=Streptomonospora wellingtoniae TaxID=3075544 RepID=A0ABU2KTN4_9ACTN|nr:FAD-binding oxidoreductase [Streptomonospora sp. DSM 45055]MDT0302644.1 FAD-binding oxidoreductase [Streptomonospora sp. DSM 45055]
MTDSTHSTRKTDLKRLEERAAGPVHRPGSGGYDRACTGYQLLEPHRPRAVVEAAGAADVQAAVRAAGEAGVPVAVQATGHGRAAALEGGVLVGTRGMDGVEVDAGAATARVGAGATWRQVVEAAAPHGLAPLSGSMPGVGAVSYTLGGGVGLLARRYGFAADRVRRVEAVTADGRLRTADAGREQELFWALRGGGGSFGVVTALEIDLVPVGRVFGGGLYFDLAERPDAVAAWARWTGAVPEATTSAVTLLMLPDAAGVPERLRGRHVAQVQICHAGPVGQGRRLARELVALAGDPVRSTLRELDFSESGAIFDEPEVPHGYRSQNLLLESLGEGAVEELVRRAGPEAPLMCVAGLRHLGGALAREPEGAGAVGRRGAAYLVSVLSPVEPGGEGAAGGLHRRVLAPFAGQGVGRSLNFSFGPTAPEDVASCFVPAVYRRLRQVKAAYDPEDRIRANHPIPPAPRR